MYPFLFQNNHRLGPRYKRSEITAHGTRDYLAAKWKVMFPNTGFWTFIKYTIVERHSYQMNPCPADADKRECEVLPADLSWEHQALLAVGFFQMTGWNRYQLNETGAPLGFLDVMDAIERDGWRPSTAVQWLRHCFGSIFHLLRRCRLSATVLAPCAMLCLA